MFYLFFEVIFVTLVLKVFLKISKFLFKKTYCLAVSRFISRVDALPSKLQKYLRKFQFLHKFRQRVSRLTCDWFATQTWPAKLYPVHLHISRVACESLTHEMCEKTIFKRLKMSVFQKLCLFAPRDFLSPNHKISSKLNQSCLNFVSWTTPR